MLEDSLKDKMKKQEIKRMQNELQIENQQHKQ